MELYDLPLSRFVDDLFMIDFTECSALARAIMLEVIDALGFTLEVDKTPTPAASQEVLGVRVTIQLSTMLLVPEPRKVALWWILALESAITSKALGHRDSSKLAGRLSFASFASWGPIARSRLRRLYVFSLCFTGRLTQPLLQDLQWWLDKLVVLSPAVVALGPTDPLVLYTDAEGSGGLGGVLADGENLEFFSCQTPQLFVAALLPRHTQIFPLEVFSCGAMAKEELRRRKPERPSRRRPKRGHHGVLSHDLQMMLGEANATRAAPSTRAEPVELLQPVRASLRRWLSCRPSCRDACVA
jgi:hypothetical protein